MNTLYPLRFKPIFKERIWGGTRLRSLLNASGDIPDKCGEAWLVVDVEDDQSVVTDGFLSENELNELVEIYMGDLVGEKVYDLYGKQFPVLVKLIDSEDVLSIQVHPDNDLAKKKHNAFGKHEMWYVVDAADDAFIINGFNKTIDNNQFMSLVKENNLITVLNQAKVKQGDVFYIPAGRVHAIGPGNLILEIQQSSDITYRIFDWNRKDAQGHTRELHIEQAAEAIDFTAVGPEKTKVVTSHNTTIPLVKCPYFVTNKLVVDTLMEKDYSDLDSFVLLINLAGKCMIEFEDGAMALNPFETLLIPAIQDNITIIPETETTLLEVYIA